MTAAHLPRAIVAVSLKMYFSHARTLAWCREVAEIAGRHQAVADGVVELVVFPSHPSLGAVADVLGPGISLGAQDIAPVEYGAYTGDVSPAVVAELGGRYAEVGHAERRRRYGETDGMVAAKVAAAHRAGLTALICVGEEEYVDPAAAADICLDQLDLTTRNDGTGARPAGRTVVAYEPVWAIGAREPAPVEHIRAVCHRLRDQRHVGGQPGTSLSAVIYGGSAGPGLLTALGESVDGVFLGRFAHDPGALDGILSEAAAASSERAISVGKV